MCFSSAVSFGTGAVMTVAGVATLRQTSQSRQVPLASIPFVFAAQQITEGFLWESIMHEDWAALKVPMTYLYIVFAQVIWPSILALSLYKLEADGWRRKFLLGLSILGILTALFRTYTLFNFAVSASVINNHIAYNLNRVSSYTRYGLIIYFLTTAVPFLFSSINWIWTMGVMIIVSYIVTFILYQESLLSVWCFFAAAISIGLFFIIRKLNDRGIEDSVQDENLELL